MRVDREAIRICRSKEGHATESAAEDMIKVAKRRAYRDADALRCYQCPVCELWHLSHRPPLLVRGYRPSAAMIAAQGGRT